jgi:hypothetical protein
MSCPYCGTDHTTICPRIRAISYFADGTVQQVEFFDPPRHQHQTWSDWPGDPRIGASTPHPTPYAALNGPPRP